MTQREQMEKMEQICRRLGLEIIKSSDGPPRFIATIDAAGQRAAEVQCEIAAAAEAYPNVVCYCFEADSTLVYAV